ncbi:MAG TPA: lipopolysaccharide kinase InaA family protein [Thermoanaerobaculia bacterium]
MIDEQPPAAAPAAPPTAFALAGWWGEAAGDWPAETLRRAVERVVEPANAARTLHWGRNYLYLVHLDGPAGPLAAVVKQFRNDGRAERLRRRLRGSKAERSWRVARALVEAGIDTPEPLLLVESERPDGPSYFVSREVAGAEEARYLLRAVNAGRAGEAYPGIDVDAFLAALARAARRLHDAGFWHRDFSSGNVLVSWDDDGRPARLALVDLNRTRCGRRPTGNERLRDLARMMIHRPEDQERFLAAYREGPPRDLDRRRYLLYHHGFRWKNEAKKAVRARTRGLVQAAKDLVLPRGAHAHIPAAPEGAGTRDRAVWDPLSDQPHLHAGKLAKLGSRLRDAPAHARHAAAAGRLLPRAWRRLREIEAAGTGAPAPFAGAGVAVRPWPADPAGLLSAVDDLGVRHALVRLHPWQDDHGDEEALAAALAGRGIEVSFSLPQSRELVRDPARWRAAVRELAGRFAPHGRRFVVGQAVNRSKWGVWSPEEYRALAAAAAEELRGHRGIEVLGPAVIDWEPHATAGYLGLAGMPRFDALASLLYVDRRGAPESRQSGYDALRKATFLAALAEVAPACEPRSWITEVNWPLREGPHSPAGRLVAVDEETQADRLVRYFVPLLGSGRVQRIFWWQVIARGYGLVAPEADGTLRRRPSWQAMATMLRQLAGTVCEGPLPAPAGARMIGFRGADGRRVVAAWAVGGEVEAEPPGEVVAAVGRDGEAVTAPNHDFRLGPSPVYLRLAQ